MTEVIDDIVPEDRYHKHALTVTVVSGVPNTYRNRHLKEVLVSMHRRPVELAEIVILIPDLILANRRPNEAP